VDRYGKYDWVVPYEVKDKQGNIIAIANATYHLRRMG